MMACSSHQIFLCHQFVLILELAGLEVFILYHVGTRASHGTSSICVFCSRLLFHIKRPNEIYDVKLLSLMLQRSSKIPSRGRLFGNYAPTTNFLGNTQV
jgi:hypothetical protein